MKDRARSAKDGYPPADKRALDNNCFIAYVMTVCKRTFKD